jgi:hypothetical protein
MCSNLGRTARLVQTTARLVRALVSAEPSDLLGVSAVLALLALSVWALVATTR